MVTEVCTACVGLRANDHWGMHNICWFAGQQSLRYARHLLVCGPTITEICTTFVGLRANSHWAMHNICWLAGQWSMRYAQHLLACGPTVTAQHLLAYRPTVTEVCTTVVGLRVKGHRSMHNICWHASQQSLMYAQHLLACGQQSLRYAQDLFACGPTVNELRTTFVGLRANGHWVMNNICWLTGQRSLRYAQHLLACRPTALRYTQHLLACGPTVTEVCAAFAGLRANGHWGMYMHTCVCIQLMRDDVTNQACKYKYKYCIVVKELLFS